MRRGHATDAAAGTGGGCGGWDRRREGKAAGTSDRWAAGWGRAAGQATCESAKQGEGEGVRHWQRASRDAEARLHGERDAEANRRGVQAIYSSDLQQRYGGSIRRRMAAA